MVTELERQLSIDKDQRHREVERSKAVKAKPRRIKTRPRPEPERRPPGHGYDQLAEPYLTYYNVAVKYARKVLAEDREDLLHDILLILYRARQDKADLTQGALYRIASRAVADYWRAYYKVNNGLDCGHCSQAQRHKCKEGDLYTECPKAIKLENLNKPILDGEGNLTELGELIADPKSLDLAEWDSQTYLWELGYPKRLVQIAYKLQAGETMTHAERTYLAKLRRRGQKQLI